MMSEKKHVFLLFLVVLECSADSTDGRTAGLNQALVLSPQQRPNIVEENPILDVGPLVVVTVARGDQARLHCKHLPSNVDDTPRLVLWYKNDTSRPFLSFDARSDYSKKPDVLQGLNRNKLPVPEKAETRLVLDKGGEFLVIQEARSLDQAEYRCTVHYRRSPSATYRFQLIVADAVHRVVLLDASERQVGAHLGPLSEGSHLSLKCKAHYSGELTSMEWLLDGQPLASSWARVEEGTAISRLEMTLKKTHSHAALTCRLTSHKKNEQSLTKSMTDASTIILLNYVPQATLFVDSASSEGVQTREGVKGGISFEVTEGQTVNFICAVKARPPPYNISWLHNGLLIGTGGRRWTRHNASLVVSPVNKHDTGLYTCVASNPEGDGQSNAVSLKVAHVPYCLQPSKQHLVVARNASVTLACEVEAEPQDVTFTWSFDPPRPTLPPKVPLQGHRSKPGTQRHGSSRREEALDKPFPIHYTHDPKNPTRSFLTLTPIRDSQGVLCYTKNRVGRTRVPCVYTLAVVDPPRKPQGCNITSVTASDVTVACLSETSTLLSKEGSNDPAPGISYVVSPEARTTSHLEVWALGTLLANRTSSNPQWEVDNLPSDTQIQLKLYTSSQHAKSQPIVLHARTNHFISMTTSGNSPGGGASSLTEVSDDVAEEGTSWSYVLILFLGVSGVVVVLVTTVVGVVLIIRARRRRRRHSSTLHVDDLPTPGTAAESVESVGELWISPPDPIVSFRAQTEVLPPLIEETVLEDKANRTKYSGVVL